MLNSAIAARDVQAFASAAHIARAIAARQISPVEVIEATLHRIESLNPELNAFLAVREEALAEAREAERGVGRERLGPLYGVPISLKDLILTRDRPTTAGSRIFGAGVTSTHDAPVVRRLKRAGAIVVGKNNLHELALGVTNLNAHFGPARNPWDRARIPGGSSGGSAVAVAAGMGVASVGSDTRGSIRIPAACCGVTGLKPTYALVPTEGVIPLAWSLDHVGPITRSAEDAALMLGAMVGRAAGRRLAEALDRPITKIRFGVAEYFLNDLDPEIARSVLEAIELFRRAGAIVVDVSLPEMEGTHGSSAVISLSEAVTYHDQSLRENPQGFGAAVRERLETGYRLSAVDRVRAERKQAEVVAAFDRVFRDVDVIVGATIPTLPPPIGQDAVRIHDRESTVLAELPRLTAAANLAGVPALSVPCGFSTAGLPIGLQLMAARGRDDLVLAAGVHYQRNTEWHQRRPPFAELA